MPMHPNTTIGIVTLTADSDLTVEFYREVIDLTLRSRGLSWLDWERRPAIWFSWSMSPV